MATATGTLNNAVAPGTITVVTDSSGQFSPGSSIDFSETLPNGSALGSSVSFDIDNSGRTPLAMNIALIAPGPPAGTTVVNTNTTANYTMTSGQTLQITGGATLTGSVTLIAATLTIDSNSVITGDVIAISGSNISIDTSTIQGDIDMLDSGSYKSVHGSNNGDINIKRNKSVIITNGSHGGDINVKKSPGGVNINNTILSAGDMKIKKSADVSVTNNKITGDLILKNNTPPCTDTGNTVSGKHVPC